MRAKHFLCFNNNRIQGEDLAQRGSKRDNVLFFVLLFFSSGRREDPNTTICGLTSARKRNAIKMVFRWRTDDGPTLNAGLVAL